HWQNRLIEMLESRMLEKVLGGKEGEQRLRKLAVEVAGRKKDPFTAGGGILEGGGKKEGRKERKKRRGRKRRDWVALDRKSPPLQAKGGAPSSFFCREA